LGSWKAIGTLICYKTIFSALDLEGMNYFEFLKNSTRTLDFQKKIIFQDKRKLAEARTERAQSN